MAHPAHAQGPREGDRVHALRRLLLTADRAAYAVERVVLLVSVFLMTALIFVDVVQRTFSRPVGKTESILLAIFGLFGEVSEETHARVVSTIGPLVFVGVGLALFVLGAHAARTAKAERAGQDAASVAFGKSLVVGAVVYGAVAGGVKLLLTVAPSGVPGAQKLALGLLVWCGFLGASVAARERRHIVLDAVLKKVDPPTKAVIAFVGGTITALVCGFLGYMSMTKTAKMITEWSESGGTIHRFESVPIPEWLVTIALPIVFFLVALRFFLQGAGELVFGAPLHANAEEHGVNLAALGAESAPKVVDEERGAPLFGVGRPHPTKGRLS